MNRVAPLGRIIITDTASQSRRHVEWGLEGPLTYNAATSLLLDSDSLVTSGFGGTQSTLAGAYDPNGSGNSCVQTVVYDSPQAVCGTGVLSHVGAFRVKARVNNGSNPAGIYWRLAWRVGDSVYTTNLPASTVIQGWVELDLGTITVPRVLSGTQSWDARVEAWKPGATDTIRLDYLALIPVSDGYGKARAAYSYTPGVVVGYDNFTSTTAGNALNGRTATAGGTWATSGDATDFVFADNFNAADGNENVGRATTGAETNGRFAILGSSALTDTQVSVDINPSGLSSEPGLIARWVDSSNYLRIRLPITAFGPNLAYLEQVVAGSVTILAQATWTYMLVPYRLQLVVFASGRAIGQVSKRDGSSMVPLEGSSAALATAGTLASGKPGFRDRSNASTSTRHYDAFTVSTPAAESIALYSGRNMQIRHDDVIRQDSSGTYTGRPRSYNGSRFLVPVGTSRVMVKARRNDIEASPDDNVTDALQIQIAWLPRGLALPR